jgi:hypothetical protein
MLCRMVLRAPRSQLIGGRNPAGIDFSGGSSVSLGSSQAFYFEESSRASSAGDASDGAVGVGAEAAGTGGAGEV